MGAVSARVERTDEVAGAVDQAIRAVTTERRPALLHVVVDPTVLLPEAPA
jgi:acetolactate synthase-1/2/3 large subunit